MKKLFISTICALGLMATSANAAWMKGKVGFIQQSGNTTIIGLNIGGTWHNYPIVAAGDAKKTIIAMALTAKASNADINLFEESGAWISVLY